jgi:hypothetical protein
MSGTGLRCPYCGNDAAFVKGSKIYPHRLDLYGKQFYLCEPCDAYVGCHKDGKPLGRLANRQLRKAKMQAHAVFDPLWKDGPLSRAEAYRWLSKAMGLHPDETHIGMFDVGQCLKVEQLVKELG